jgi:hypothetical protein
MSVGSSVNDSKGESVGPLMRLALASLMLAMLMMSPASCATCWESGEGATAVYRNPSVPAEFKSAVLVITGRVTDARNISEPDDPDGYAWTVYTVQVLQTFKGSPPRTIRLLSENSSARFYMDTGQTYLLFVSHSPVAEMAGQERLPTDYIDDCGNSALVKDAKSAVDKVKELSKSR